MRGWEARRSGRLLRPDRPWVPGGMAAAGSPVTGGSHMTIRLLMADDQELFRSALAALLALRGQPTAHSGRHVPGDPFGPGTIPRS
jgi:hypothetical protein